MTKRTGRLWQPQARTPSFLGEPGPVRRGGTAEGFLHGLTERQDRALACLAARQWALAAALAAPLGPSAVPLPRNYGSVRTMPATNAQLARAAVAEVGRCLDKEGAVPADRARDAL